jgi:hypothetical protein
MTADFYRLNRIIDGPNDGYTIKVSSRHHSPGPRPSEDRKMSRGPEPQQVALGMDRDFPLGQFTDPLTTTHVHPYMPAPTHLTELNRLLAGSTAHHRTDDQRQRRRVHHPLIRQESGQAAVRLWPPKLRSDD